MKRWLAVFGVFAAVVYLSYVRESEACVFRRRRAAAPCRPVVCTPCQPAVVAAPAAPPAVAPADPTPIPTLNPGPDTTPIPLPPPKAGGRLHAVLLVDDAVPHAAGATAFAAALRSAVASGRLGAVERITGLDLAPDILRGRIDALPVGAEDALVCYYSGAAEYDEAKKEYLLAPLSAAGKKIARSELRVLLLQRRARLTVLLTDAPTHAAAVPGATPLPPAPSAPEAAEALFFGPRGLVDLHACAATEFAAARNSEGGVFTLALARELNRPAGRRAWAVFVDALRTATDELYKDHRRQVLAAEVPEPVRRAYREQRAQTVTTLTPLDQVAADVPAETPVSPPPAPPVAVAPAPPTAPPVAAYVPPTTAMAAELIVSAPAGARLFVDDRLTQQVTRERRFLTPDLQPGHTYYYILRLEAGDGAAQTRRVEVRAGEAVRVALDGTAP